MARKLTNAEKLKIQDGLGKNKTIAELAKEFNVKDSLIQDYLDNLFAALAKVEAERKKAAEEAKPRSAIVTTTRDKKVGGVAIMNEAASAQGDAAMAKTTINNPSVVGVINPNKGR